MPQYTTIGAITDLDYHIDEKNQIKKEQDVDLRDLSLEHSDS